MATPSVPTPRPSLEEPRRRHADSFWDVRECRWQRSPQRTDLSAALVDPGAAPGSPPGEDRLLQVGDAGR
jgi:hypothetical protein